MKIERTKNASRNIATGLALKVYRTVAPFIMRTALIYLLGVQYLGLSSLFTSILEVLNLAELGVGSAMVYSMYKPIVDDDVDTICALMNLYKKYYRIIGLVVLVLGIALYPFVPKLIHGAVPSDINVRYLFLFYLATTVLSYWLFAYKNALLQAHQRVDVTNNIGLVFDTVKYILQLIVLFLIPNYYWYVVIILVTQIMVNLYTAYRVDRMYPQYIAKGDLPKQSVKEINQRVKDLFTSKVGAIIVNSSDTIVISAFLGLTALAIYQNYFYILSSIIAIVLVLFQSSMAGIGNSIIVESSEKNYSDFRQFTFIIAWVATFATSCLSVLYQPFMLIWVGEDLMVSMSVVVCLCVYYFVYEFNQLMNVYKDAAGMWHEDRWRPLVTALTNLGLNLLMVRHFGLYGIMLSTVIAMVFVGMPWLLHNLFTVIFPHEYLKNYLGLLAKYTVIGLVVSSVTYVSTTMIRLSPWLDFFVKLAICLVLPNILLFIICFKDKEFIATLRLADRMVRGKLPFGKLASKLEK